MNEKECGSLRVLKFKYRKGDQIIQTFCRIGFCPPEPRSSLFNLQKFPDSEKSTPESSEMHGNLMNDEGFWVLKLLKLKYRRRDEII